MINIAGRSVVVVEWPLGYEGDVCKCCIFEGSDDCPTIAGYHTLCSAIACITDNNDIYFKEVDLENRDNNCNTIRP